MARKPIERVAQPAAAPAPAAPPAPSVFTNRTHATTIHLGDGRKVAPGESVEVSPELLRILEA